MKYLNIFFMMLFVSTAAFSQTLTPKFGLEAGASLKRIDQMAGYDRHAPSGYIGFYTNVPLTSDRFYAKFGTGLNFTSVHRDEARGFQNANGTYPDSLLIKEDYSVLFTMSVSTELRYRLLPGTPGRGNLYLSLPVTFESDPVSKWAIRSELKIVPGLVYQYEFNKNWNIEVNAGLGYGKYFAPNDGIRNPDPLSTLEYTASLRLGYTF